MPFLFSRITSMTSSSWHTFFHSTSQICLPLWGFFCAIGVPASLLLLWQFLSVRYLWPFCHVLESKQAYLQAELHSSLDPVSPVQASALLSEHFVCCPWSPGTLLFNWSLTGFLCQPLFLLPSSQFPNFSLKPHKSLLKGILL